MKLLTQKLLQSVWFKKLSKIIDQNAFKGSCHTLLAQVDFLMPFPPYLGGREHASSTALITKGSLASPMRSST